METKVDTTTIGAFVTIILAFLGIAKIMLNQATKDRDADREERLKLSEAIEKMATSGQKVAESNKTIAKEVKEQSKQIRIGNEQSAERNGHLGELIVKQGEQTQRIADTAVASIITGVTSTHVDTMNVDKQVIKGK